MILLCQDIKGEEFALEAKEVMEIIPCPALFQSDNLLEPITGLIPYRGMILPLQGEVPAPGSTVKDFWIVISKTHGQVVRELPQLRKDKNAADIEDSVDNDDEAEPLSKVA